MTDRPPAAPPAPADHVAFIRAHPPFDALDPDAFRCVVEAAEIVYVEHSERILFQGGAPSPYMYLIRKGVVRLERDGQVVLVLEEGDLFGFPSLISGEPPAFDVVADGEVLTYRISIDRCRTLLEQPAWSDFVVQGLQQRLSRTAVVKTPGPWGDLGERVGALVQGPPHWLQPDATIREAAAAMRDEGISSVLVRGAQPGIVTDRDLRGRVLAAGRGPGTRVGEVATRPLRTLPDSAPVHEAIAFMLEAQVHHLPLTRGGDIVGVVSSGDLLRHQSQSPLHLGKRLRRAESPADVEGYADEVAATVGRLVAQGVDAVRLGRVIAGLNDTVVRRALAMAEDALGPPPRAYEWIVHGSEGRMEQALLTDQDNALVWEDGPGPDPETYFDHLARHVIDTLLLAGFPPCPGGYMATRWHASIQEWDQRFRRWIALEEPRALLDAANFFDFRGVRGDLSLDPLTARIHDARSNKIFLAHMAAEALRFRPPVGLFGRIRGHDGLIDLKRDAIIPLVGLARVHALASGSNARSTTDRLRDAAAAGTISPADAETLVEAFGLALRLRLRAQLRALEDGEDVTNEIPLDGLSTLERRHVKESLLAIRDAQDSLARRYQTERLG